MLIEQIIEFKFNRTSAPITAYFHDKAKTSKANLRIAYYLPLKYCRRQCTLLPSAWAKSLTKFYTKTQDFKRLTEF